MTASQACAASSGQRVVNDQVRVTAALPAVPVKLTS
jgi:hypothetical protein